MVELSGVSRSTYLRWEAGDASRPGPDEVRAVCRVLNIKPREAVVALGWIDQQDLEPGETRERLPDELEEVITILRDPRVPATRKREWMAYLRYLRAQGLDEAGSAHSVG